VIEDTEDSNEAIVKGEMVETPPGCMATACCPKDDAGTWENLCFPISLESTFRMYMIGGLCGTPQNKTQPADVRSGAGGRAKKKPLLYNQEERRENRSDFEWLDNR
jgi:hypothetical protein